MKTILVPVNFTEVSENAARFAIKLAEQLTYEKIVLYHAYETPIPQNTDPMGINAAPFSVYDIEDFKAISENGLKYLKSQLEHQLPASLALDTLSEYGGMTSMEVDEACGKVGADLIVTGTSDESFLDDTGSNAVHLAKSTTIPLIAVPIHYSFKTIENIVLACDLKKVAETVPVGAIEKILTATKSKFLVLHIQESDEEEILEKEELSLHQQFDIYNPEYHHVKNHDFADAINSFVAEKNIDLIITIPKKHGWLEGLFKSSHLKTLAFHSPVPLLMTHD